MDLRKQMILMSKNMSNPHTTENRGLKTQSYFNHKPQVFRTEQTNRALVSMDKQQPREHDPSSKFPSYLQKGGISHRLAVGVMREKSIEMNGYQVGRMTKHSDFIHKSHRATTQFAKNEHADDDGEDSIYGDLPSEEYIE